MGDHVTTSMKLKQQNMTSTLGIPPPHQLSPSHYSSKGSHYPNFLTVLFNVCTVKFFMVCNSMSFDTCIESCSHPYNPEYKTVPLSQHFSHACPSVINTFSQPLTSTDFLSVPIVLPLPKYSINGISYVAFWM